MSKCHSEQQSTRKTEGEYTGFWGPMLEERNIAVNQECYIETMLEWFQMDQCEPKRTPANFNLELQTTQNGDKKVNQKIYKSFVGLLRYLVKQTRQDIMFTVQHSVQSHKCTCQSALAMRKIILTISSSIKRIISLLFKRS